MRWATCWPYAQSARSDSPLRVMLAAHMDEVGFMLVEDEEGGLFRFETGRRDRRAPAGRQAGAGGQRAHPRCDRRAPIHLTTPEERKSAIPLDSLRIDLGPGGDSKAKVGDRATFATRFAAAWSQPDAARRWITAWASPP